MHQFDVVALGLAQQEHLARRPLVQQRRHGFNMRVRHAPALRHPAQQQIGQSHQAHPLVVGHEGADRGKRRVLGLARRGVVQRFDEAVAGARCQALQPLEVGHGQARRERSGQCRGVGRDDQLIRRCAPHGQAWHALRCVLVGQRVITGGVGRFTDTPGHALLAGERHLLLHGHQAGAVQSAANRLIQNQRRHQVFEHRTRPGAQPGRRSSGEERSPQCRPVTHRHVSLGDGQQAGQTRFRGQQVIKARVQLLFGHAVTDMQQMALGVVEKAELALPCEPLQHRGHGQQPRDCLGRFQRLVRGWRRQFAAGLCHREQMAAQVAAVHRGYVHRQQRRAALRVVPVQEVAAVALQPAKCRQRRLQPGQQLCGRNPAESACARRAQKIDADVGG